MKTNHITYSKVKEVFESKGYAFFNKGNFNLNIFGIRNLNTSPNHFDDIIGIAFLNEKGEESLVLFPATTDPGRFYLLNPMNVNGTAILKEGQYKSAFKLGLHHSSYMALTQAKELPVYRDRNRDELLDLDDSHITIGFFGINIHRASEIATSKEVGKWSAGCQVIQSPTDFALFIALCKWQNSKYGNSFTYTLLNEKDFA